MERERSAASSALAWMRSLLPALSVVALLAVVPYALLCTQFWAASGSWDFEGSGGLKRWLLVTGSRLDQLGFVAETTAPARYSVRFQEGTFPGWRVVGYASTASPADIIAAYADRCIAMGLRITVREPARSTVPGNQEATLVCEIERYIDAEILAERKVSATVTNVSLRVWGSD